MSEEKKSGAALSPWADRIDFKMFTDPLEARKTADGIVNLERPQVVGLGSSELEDLAGDKMLQSAMDDMKNFSVRSAIFMNHRYDIPEDVFGALKQPPTLKIENPMGIGLSNAKRPFYAVGITVDVARSSERAMKSFALISEDEIRLGLSIGCEITDYDIRKDADGLPVGLDIAHLKTLEWSIVGIPCNTESWIQNWAEKGFNGLVKRKAHLPAIKSGDQLMYVAKNFGDFDDVTGLFLRRLNQSAKLAYVVDNFDEIEKQYDANTAALLKSISEPLMKHGFCIARYPQKR